MNKQRSIKNLEQAQVRIYELERDKKELYEELDCKEKLIESYADYSQIPPEEMAGMYDS